MADNTINIGNFLQEYVEVGRVTNEKLDALANLLGGVIEGNENIKSSLVRQEIKENQRKEGLDKDKDKSSIGNLEIVMRRILLGANDLVQRAVLKSAEYIKNTGANIVEAGNKKQEDSKFQTGLRAKATLATGKVQAGFGKGLGGLARILKTLTKTLGPIAAIFLNLGAVIDVAVGSIGFLAAYLTGSALTSFMTYYHMLSDAFKAIKDYFLGFKEDIISWWTDTKAGFNILSTSASDFAGKIAESSNYIGELFPKLKKYTNEIASLSEEVSNYWGDPPTPAEWWEDFKEGFNIVTDVLIDYIGSWWDGLSESFEEIMDGVWVHIEDFKSSIQYVIDTLISAFTTFTDSNLNPLNWFSGDKKAEEFDKKQKEKLVPTVDQSTIKGNQPTANSRVLKSEKTQEELIKIYKENNKAIEESNKEAKLMNQKFELLINTLDSKDFSTQIYNNTTNNTTSTPSFGSGNSIRR